MAGNKNIVLIVGPPSTGKSAALLNLRNQEKLVYLNTDLKELPFADRFMANVEIADAADIGAYVHQIENEPSCEGGILDTLTFLMSMYERQYVSNATNTQKAWGDYGTFYRDFIHAIKSGTKNYAILAHEEISLNEQTHQLESKVPVKGSVGRTGVEADFTTVLATRQVPIKQLEGFENDLLDITEEEIEDGVKHVFVTRSVKEYAGGKMRAAMGLWSRKELYIDNDLQQVFDRLNQYYNKG